MANSKGPSTMRSMMYTGKNPLLPPKSPFPSIAPSYADYVSNPAVAPKGPPKYRDANSHQRTSSESFLIEEQPSWLDDLLNEPESPVRRGHRRSSSDSFTYMEAANAVFNNEYRTQNDYRLRNLGSIPSWGPQDFDIYKDSRNPSFYGEHNVLMKNKNRAWDPSQNASTHSNASRELDGTTSIASEKKDAVESVRQDGDSSERKDSSSNQASASETDTKRAKQKFAQRSRVRKWNPFSFRRSSSSSSTTRRRRTTKKVGESPLLTSQQSSNTPSPPSPANVGDVVAATGSGKPLGVAVAKPKKKAGGARLWMRFDRSGESELFECDKNTIIKRAGIPARDLRILGPVFSNSSNILAREKAIVVNLEHIKAIVTAEEVLLLDPLRQEVLPFVDQLRHQLSHKNHFNTFGIQGGRQLALRDTESNLSASGRWQPVPETAEGLQAELPFEFQVLEIALEVVCTYLDSSVADLERDAYPVLDELAKNVSTKNLERVRSVKSNLTRLLARVQKVRDELEHLLDDDEDMTQLYLTRKWLQNQQSEALLGGIGSNSFPNNAQHLRRLSSVKSGSMLTSGNLNENDVEDLEMLLEAYFMQLDGTRNKILSVREYIDDTEDYVNIQLDNQRNELIQLQLTLTIASFAIAFETLVAGLFGMNIHCHLYDIEGIFEPFVGGITAASLVLFLLVLGYARWKKLLGS